VLVLVIGALGCSVALPQAASNPREQSSGIGYATVAQALAALRADPKVQISVQQGWTIAVDKSTETIWAFVPMGDPAYPAVSKATPVSRDGGIYVERRILCQASKAACDQLVQRFKQLDERIRQSMHTRSNSSAKRTAVPLRGPSAAYLKRYAS
jgi:hypothetical protein